MIRCKECKYHEQSCSGFISTNFTEGVGPKDSGVMLVFDSPFKGDATAESIGSNVEYNRYLNKYLQQINLNTESIYVTSFIKCLISDKSKQPTKGIKETCVGLYLDKEIKTIKPKVIILIGRMSTQYFLPDVNAKVPLRQIIGRSFYNSTYNCYIVPMYDMYYLTNFTNKATQVRQTEKAFARVKVHLTQSDIEIPTENITYSSDIKLLSSLGKYVAIDVETTGLDYRKDKIVTIALSDGKLNLSFDIEDYKDEHSEIVEIKQGAIPKKCQTAALFETIVDDRPTSYELKGFKYFYKTILGQIVSALKTRKIVGHNMSFDLSMLLSHGYNLTDNLVSDTRFMQFLVNPNGANGLGFLVQLYYGIAYKDNIQRDNILAMESKDRAYYCAQDTYYTFKLFTALFKRLKEQDSLIANKIFTRLIANLVLTERHGIGADKEKIEELITYYTEERDKCAQKFKKRFELDDTFNLNSNKQLCKLLYETLELPVTVRTKTKNSITGLGNPSTDYEAICKLAQQRPTLNTLVDYRTMKGHLEKLQGYKEAISDDGRIHSSFNCFSPESSRVMSSKPNIQNVPRDSRLKEIFIPAKGYTYVYFDFSQVEFRVWIDLSKDPKGIEFINAGKDIHSFIASRFYRLPEAYFLDKQNKDGKAKRSQTKGVVYGSMFGRTPQGIVKEHGGTVDEAMSIQAIFFSLCKKGWFWLQQIEQDVVNKKKLRTPFGSYRFFNDIELATPIEKEEQIRQAKSFIVQSWAAELGFLGLNKTIKKLKDANLDAILVNNIHDANIFEVRDEHVDEVKQIILDTMQNPYEKLSIPLSIEIKTGKSWAEVA